jgi:proteic killer suppression protein
MDIKFGDKKLKKVANNDRKLQTEYGKIRANLIKIRLEDLTNAVCLEDLRHVAGNYHELKSNYKGYWACDLDQPYRLIFKPQEEPIPINKDGQYIWSEIFGVEITEITNYH